MSLVALALTATMAVPQRPEPVLWLSPRGSLLVSGQPIKGRLTQGAQEVRTPLGQGLEIGGKRGGLLLQDLPAFALGRSITISSWIYLRGYPGEQAQILFRGDDRPGYDSYSLCIRANGHVQFRMDDGDLRSTTLEAEIPLKRWTHVTASFDAETGEIRLYRGERLVATRETDKKLVFTLDKAAAPGVGIGNVQNDRGPHNQPLNGMLADVRLYDSVVTPAEAGWRANLDKLTP